MKLYLNTYPFRFEHAYELGFGPSCFDSLAEIIQAFTDADKEVLFAFFDYDKDKEPHKNEISEEILMGFYNDTHRDGEAERQVKEILFNFYYEEEQKHEHINIEELKNQLLTQFRNTDIDLLNDVVKDQLKASLYRCFMKYGFNDIELSTQLFIQERLKYENLAWPFPQEKPDFLKRILWYKVLSKEEIIHALTDTDWWFKCVIASPNRKFEEYTYFLNYTEEHGDECDGMVLYISTKEVNHFQNVIVPRLQQLYSTLEIVR
ncbi:hypothetical protein WMW72_11325 [Paenibacillus filicis]|uniref:Uncharacterized protein n=1 Tax=Paenibacillus filicis TaxID=669464 RepID=A0ABU9DHY8_9BACL